MPLRSRKIRHLIIAYAVLLLVCDVAAAQLFNHFFDTREKERQYRKRNAVYHHDLAPNAEFQGHWGPLTYVIRTNSLGFKDAAVRDVPMSSDKKRVLFIGDSFTEGIGIEYEDTFVGIIGATLRADDVEVLNAGVTTYSPSIYYRKIRYLIENVGLEFDEVVLCMDISDIEDEAKGYDLDDNEVVVSTIAEDRPLSLRQFLKTNSALLHIAAASRNRILDKGSWTPRFTDTADAWSRLKDLPRGSWTFDDEAFEDFGRSGLVQAAESMEKLDALLTLHDIALTIVVYPWPAQILARDLHSRQVAYWSGWAQAHGRGFIDLFPAFVDEDDASDPRETVKRLFIAWDVHFNEEGHRVAAREILASYRLPSSTPASWPRWDEETR